MKKIGRVTRLWFFSWFGTLMAYEKEKGWYPAPFEPGKFPDFFDLALWPIAQLPFRLRLRQKDYLPTELPPMEAVDARKGPVDHAREGTVALRSLENNAYLTTDPHNKIFEFRAYEPREWEFFLPLTQEILQGMSALASRKIAQVSDKDGNILPEATFREGHRIVFCEREYSLLDNIALLEEIGALASGEEMSCEFGHGGELIPITVKMI